MERRINIFANNKVIAIVAERDIIGRTLWGGIARLPSGEWVYVFTHETDSARDRGWLITAEEAVMEIIAKDQEELLALPELEELKELDCDELRNCINL